MKRENFFGKNLTPGIEPFVHNARQEEMDEIREKRYRTEREKTSEEIEYVALINEYIKEEFDELKIDGFEPISPKDVRIVELANPNAVAWIDYEKKQVFINSNLSKSDILAAMLHEMIHAASYQKYHVTVDEEKKTFNYKHYRVGYESRNPQKNIILSRR